MFTIASIFKHIRFRSADENNWNGVVKLSDHMPLILLKKNSKVDWKDDLAESCLGK